MSLKESRLKEISKIFPLLIYAWFFVSTHFFMHAHYVNNVVYVHSHPFAKTTHQHSPEQFFLIQQLSVVVTDAVTVTAFFSLILILLYVFGVPLQQRLATSVVTGRHFCRPPPRTTLF